MKRRAGALSAILNKLLEDIASQKRKYHAKVLSVDGEWDMFLRSFQLYDFILDISNLLIPEFYFASLSTSLLFGMDPSDIEPFNLDFTWRYPSQDEWVNGVSVVIEKVKTPCAVGLSEFIEDNIKPEYQPAITSSMLGKGFYGTSRYGYAYYDPGAVREFLRNAVQLMIKKHADPLQRKTALLSLARSLNVPEDLARNVHDRMQMVMTAHTECFILDYGMLDITKLCESAVHSEEYALMPYVDLDGNLHTVEVLTLDDMQYGCILDETLLDYCFLTTDESIYMTPGPPATPAVAPVIDECLDQKLKSFRDRIALTGPAFSNYTRGDEAMDYKRSDRLEYWGELLSDRYMIENLADTALRQLLQGVDPVTRRTYISAVLQLWGHRGKRHEWGFNVFKEAGLDEVKSWWLDYWTNQGLDRSVLENLFNRLSTSIEHMVNKKVELGRKIRLQRLGIPID
jgi:hypothetical protein